MGRKSGEYKHVYEAAHNMVDHICLIFLVFITLVICIEADLALLVQIYLITTIILKKSFA